MAAGLDHHGIHGPLQFSLAAAGLVRSFETDRKKNRQN
jgi:hypothetical protein